MEIEREIVMVMNIGTRREGWIKRYRLKERRKRWREEIEMEIEREIIMVMNIGTRREGWIKRYRLKKRR